MFFFIYIFDTMKYSVETDVDKTRVSETEQSKERKRAPANNGKADGFLSGWAVN